MRLIILIFIFLSYYSISQDWPNTDSIDFDSAIVPKNKLALIIANTDYTEEVLKLETPIKDAKLLRNTLDDSLDFDVIYSLDIDLDSMNTLILQFTDRMKIYDFGIIYFAGHGMADKYNNSLLVPINFKNDYRFNESEILKNTLSSYDIIKRVRDHKVLFIVDACRTFHEVGSYKKVLEPESLKLCLSTAFDKPTYENITNNNSFYAENFCNQLNKQKKQNLNLDLLLKRVKNLVELYSKNNQIPKMYNGDDLNNIILIR